MSIESLPTDSGKQYIQTGRNGRLTGFKLENLQYSIIGRLIIYRLLHNRDMKILITSKGSTTGTGKTTLAVHLARFVTGVANEIFDRNKSWNAEEQSFVDVWDYLRQYKEADSGDALVTDELEYMADRRRSMSTQNVKFSQAWEILRYKNVVTIGTAPSIWDLDKRVPENSDIWINVIHKGRANTYYLSVNDFTGDLERKRLKLLGYRETIRWTDLAGDKDFEFLAQEKEDIGVPGIDDIQQYDEQDVKDAKREIKTKVVIDLLEKKEAGEIDLTQAEIGDIAGYSQQSVAKIKRENIA